MLLPDHRHALDIGASGPRPSPHRGRRRDRLICVCDGCVCRHGEFESRRGRDPVDRAVLITKLDGDGKWVWSIPAPNPSVSSGIAGRRFAADATKLIIGGEADGIGTVDLDPGAGLIFITAPGGAVTRYGFYGRAAGDFDRDLRPPVDELPQEGNRTSELRCSGRRRDQKPSLGGRRSEPPRPADTRADERSAAPFTTRLLPEPPKGHPERVRTRTAATGFRELKLVGARGFEPPTFRSRTERATRLRHAPSVKC